MNFDTIARPYRWMEYLSFGPLLERCRFAQLDRLGNPQRALVLGDGDGRFLARLLARYPGVHADAVELSPAMGHLAQQRVRAIGATGRVEFHLTDIRTFTPRGDVRYDLVVTHFFLDCFFDAEIEAMLTRLAPHLVSETTWLVSEFAIPAKQPLGSVAHILVTSLYFCFRLLTGLQTRRLPHYTASMRQAGFHLEEACLFLGGILRSERWAYLP